MVFSAAGKSTILAIEGGTPISLFGADSCKTAGLAKFLEKSSMKVAFTK